jgi:hypothetical protein
MFISTDYMQYFVRSKLPLAHHGAYSDRVLLDLQIPMAVLSGDCILFRVLAWRAIQGMAISLVTFMLVGTVLQYF